MIQTSGSSILMASPLFLVTSYIYSRDPEASYSDFEPFLLEEKHLKTNGFPLPDTTPGKAMFRSTEPTENNATLTSCCHQSLSSPGCAIRPYHVHMHNKFSDLENYIQFGPPLPRSENDVNVFAIDCEMVYTDFG
nr:hypothetical transcript [Hymenolepis microstoma]